MPLDLRIDSGVKVDMLDCDHEAQQEIYNFVSALESNAYPARCEELGPLCFFSQLKCGYFVSWEAIPNPARPPTIKDPELIAVRARCRKKSTAAA